MRWNFVWARLAGRTVADTSRLTRWRCRVGDTRAGSVLSWQAGSHPYKTGDLDGLVEWLPTRLIVCRWTERNAFQKDEERAAKLSASAAEVWDPVYEEAISAVMTASGEYGDSRRAGRPTLPQRSASGAVPGLSGSPLG